jgi:hypothetical protein
MPRLWLQLLADFFFAVLADQTNFGGVGFSWYIPANLLLSVDIDLDILGSDSSMDEGPSDDFASKPDPVEPDGPSGNDGGMVQAEVVTIAITFPEIFTVIQGPSSSKMKSFLETLFTAVKLIAGVVTAVNANFTCLTLLLRISTPPPS